ncbi:MAG: nucleoside-triphosphatase [Terriglobia bacterium]
MKVVVTGRPGVGKTTLIKELVGQDSADIGGFYTEEERAGGRRAGFTVVTMGHGRVRLAGENLDSNYSVGRYRVNVQGFERLVLPELEGARLAGKLLVIDEIGKMELLSDRFVALVREILGGPARMIASCGMIEHPLITEMMNDPEIRAAVRALWPRGAGRPAAQERGGAANRNE